MICTLTPSQLEDLLVMVSGDLSDIVKAGNKFDYKTYMKELYDLIKANSPYESAEDTEALALDYARQAAIMIHEVAAIGKVKKEGKQVRLSVELSEVGFSSDALIKEIKKFEDPNTGLEAVAAIVNPVTGIAQDLKNAQIVQDLISQEEELNKPEEVKEAVIKKAEPSVRTTDKETVSRDSTRRNPLLTVYYKIQRAIVNFVKEAINTNSKSVEYPGIGKIYIKLVAGRSIDAENRRAADSQVSDFDKRVYAVVVDEDGNFLYANEDGTLAKEGKKFAYYSANEVGSQIANYLNENTGNFIKADITGGSLGELANITPGERKLKDIKGITSSTTIYPRDASSRFPYYQIEGYPGILTLTTPKFGDFNQRAKLEKIVDLLINKVYERNTELSFEDKLEKMKFMFSLEGARKKETKNLIKSKIEQVTNQNKNQIRTELMGIIGEIYFNIDYPLFNANIYRDFDVNTTETVDGRVMFQEGPQKRYKEDYLFENFTSQGKFDSEGNPAIFDSYLEFQPQEAEVDKYTKAITTQPSTTIKPGVEISSNAKGLAAALTNPTELAKSKGNLTQSYPVDFRGKTYKDAEAAYQALKSTATKDDGPNSTYNLMVDILKAKLQQYPRLVEEITKQGGTSWILSSTHQPTKKNTVWETGGKNWFIKALNDAYISLTAPEVNTQEQTTTAPGIQETISLDDIANMAIKDIDSLPKLIGVKSLNGKESVVKIANGLIWFLGGKEALKHPAMKKFMSALSRTEVEQIKALAAENPEASPLATKYKVPVELVFKAVNSGPRVAAATWSVNGIVLNQYMREEGETIDETISGDFSDIYHEAWHGFTQTWLTEDQRKKMYAEASKQKGSFTDYNGNKVTFANAKPIQLEEYLAEEFRKFMLSGGTYKRPETPVQNSIFDWLFNLIKKLFGKAKTTDSEMPTIQELYQKLKVGDLSGFNFDVNNRDKTIGQLNKAVEKIPSNTDDIDLNHQDSMQLINTIDSIISNIVDFTNKKSGTNRFTVGFFKKEENMKVAYKYTKQQLETTIKKHLEDKIAKSEGAEKTHFEKQLSLVNWALRNFGDTENLKNNRDGKGLIAYHQMKSKFISYEDRKNFFADINEEALSTKGREGYGDRAGNEFSHQELGDPDVHALLRSIYAFKGKDKVLNDFGTQDLVPYDLMWNKLAKILTGTVTIDKMEAALKEAAKTDGTIEHLLEKLGDKNASQYDEEYSLWTKFWQTFNGSLIPLVQVNVEENKVGDTDITRYVIKVGRSSAPYAQVANRWSNTFEYLTSDEVDTFDKDPLTNQSYIDLKKLFKKFPNGVTREERMEFFRSLGIYFSSDPKITAAIEKNNVGGASDVWSNLANLYSKHGVPRINSLEEVFIAYKEKPSVDKDGKKVVAPALESLETYYKKLQELEARNSDYTTNFLSSNAEGNSQYEYSLNNTLSILTDALNTADSFEALTSMPHMAQFREELSAWSKSSSILNSLFDMGNPVKKERRKDKDGKPIKINLSNLSGVQLIREDGTVGIASASADVFTKFIQDLHLMAIAGKPELPRHADKTSSFSTYVDRIYPIGVGASRGSLYVDIEDFAKDQGKSGKNRAFTIVKNYINSELDRIRRFKALQERVDKGEDIQFDFKYLKKGQDFVVFEDVLSDKTKKLLLKADSSLTLDEILNLNEGDIYDKLRGDFDKYFDVQVQKANEYFDKVDKFTAENLLITIERQSKVNRQQAKVAAINAFVYNSWIHNVESMIIIYGDIAQYKDADDFTKRIAGSGSTGKIMRSDTAGIQYVNNKKNKYAMKRLGTTMDPNQASDLNNIGLDGTLNSAVLEDNKIGTQYIDQLREAITEDVVKRNKDKKLSKKKISEIVEKELGDYVDSMNEGDAQGWISFDAYRALSYLEGKWRPEHEKMYNDIIEGKVKPDYETIKYFFPVRKFQYWGSVKNDYAAANAFHKFSLMPLIPSLTEDTSIDDLHLKMMNEGIHYALFESGSKISTITTNGVKDKFYTNKEERTIVNINDKAFTKNTVHLQFLKDQLDIADEYKGNVTFPTQMRKLIESGLMEGGVPVDFKPKLSLEARVKLWSTVVDKEAESPIYKLVINYESSISALTKKLTDDLIKEASIEFDSDGNIIFNDNLANFMINALRSEDLAEHEIDFLKKAPGGKNFAHDLSLSLSAEKIEKALNSIIVKRLVKQKFNGEGLIQVSGAGFEKKAPKFRVATDEERLKYKGTNDLPFYRRSGGKDGKTSAAKIKIALQGDFVKLLNLTHPDGNKIETVERLNQLISDDAWLDTGNNRRMITITGARIPVQGLNSMEFMEVYEFLDPTAGNIIILPSEIVAKSGSDFDIDKLTMMMPNIDSNYSFKKWTTKEGRELLKTLASENSDIADRLTPDNVGIILDIFKNKEELFKLDESDNKILEILKANSEFNVGLESGNTVGGLQNKVIQSMIDILEMPENYLSLVKPNSTYIAKDLADNLAAKVLDYNNNYRVHDEVTGKPAGTRVFEIGFNLYKHSSHNIGKETLGLGAVDNTYNSVFNRIGFYLNPTYTAGFGTEKFEKRATILLPHNKLNNGISLSHIMDVNNENYVGDIISQLINGWVDVAKDAWIFNIQGNKEASPTLLFLVQAGVPFKQAVHLMSQPIIREYIQEQRKAKSIFANALGEDIENPNFFRGHTRDKFMNRYFLQRKGVVYEEGFEYDNLNSAEKQKFIYDRTLEYTNNPEFLKFVSDPKAIEGNITSKTVSDNDLAALLHFFELEDMAKTVRDVKLRTNFDTTRSSSAYDAEDKIALAEALETNDLIPGDLLDKILNDTPIGSFYVQPFQVKAWKGFFELRNNENVNDFLKNYIKKNRSAVYRVYGDASEFIKAFKNNLPSFVFQNELKAFDITKPSTFNGLTINTKAGPAVLKTALNLATGIAVKKVGGENIIYLDKDTLIKNYKEFKENRGNFKPSSKEGKISSGPAYVNPMAFNNVPSDEYFRFVVAREVLRATYSKEAMIQREDYKELLSSNMKNQLYTLEGETSEAHKARMENLTYEEIIRDMALDSTFNIWKLFKSDKTVADEFFSIINKHPSLLDDYAIVQNFKKSVSKDKKVKNLVFTDTALTSDKLNIFNENLLELSNSSSIKLDINEEEKDRVAQFFKRLSTYAFLQSGLNTASSFSIIRAVPQQDYLNKMIPAAGWFTKELEKASPEQVDAMLTTFVQKMKTNRASKTRNRFSDYQVSKYKSIRSANKQQTIIDTKEDNSGNIIYQTKLKDKEGPEGKYRVSYTEEEAANLMNTMDNVMFVAEVPLETPANQRDQNPLYVANNVKGMSNFIPLVTRNTINPDGVFTDQLAEDQRELEELENFKNEQIYQAQKDAYDSGSFGTRAEMIIADNGGFRTDPESFRRFGDWNNLKGNSTLILMYFKDGGLPLDVIADDLGIEVEDLIDFMYKYPAGVGTKNSKTLNTFYGYHNPDVRQGFVKSETFKKKELAKTKPKKVGFDIKEISPNTKDPKKAAVATDIIEFGRKDPKTGRVSSSQKYGEAAVNQGIPRNSGVYDSGTVAMVSVAGNNVSTSEDINNTVDQIIKVLNAGGSIIMDNKKNRESNWNKSGEGAVFEAVMNKLGVKNLTNISKDPDYVQIKYKTNIPVAVNGLVEPNAIVKEQIDKFIEHAKEVKASGMQLGFPVAGIAQYMRKGDIFARQTFLYLSKRLLEVGYVNPGLLEVQSDPDNQVSESGIEMVEKVQQVSVREASDKLLECFGRR